MKKILLIVSLLFLFISCTTKKYVWNSHNNPRPTCEYKFLLDKKSFILGSNLIVDTNSIYIATSYKRKLPQITSIFYRFYPNGIVYEFVLKGEPIDSAIVDTAMGNYGKYRIVGLNKIRMEFMVKQVEKSSNKVLVTKNFVNAEIVEENLVLKPTLYCKQKGFYSEALEGMSGAYGPGAGGIALLLGAVFFVDAAIPDEKAVFLDSTSIM